MPFAGKLGKVAAEVVQRGSLALGAAPGGSLFSPGARRVGGLFGLAACTQQVQPFPAAFFKFQAKVLGPPCSHSVMLPEQAEEE